MTMCLTFGWMVASLSPVSKLLKTAVTSIAHNWIQLHTIAQNCTGTNTQRASQTTSNTEKHCTEKCSHLLQLPVGQHLWIVGHVVAHPHLGYVGFNMSISSDANHCFFASSPPSPELVVQNTIKTTTLTDTNNAVSVWTSVSIGLSSRSSIASYSLFKLKKINKRWGRGIILVWFEHFKRHLHVGGHRGTCPHAEALSVTQCMFKIPPL